MTTPTAVLEARQQQPHRRPPSSPKLHAQRVAWGLESGAKVAAAYKLRTEGA